MIYSNMSILHISFTPAFPAYSSLLESYVRSKRPKTDDKSLVSFVSDMVNGVILMLPVLSALSKVQLSTAVGLPNDIVLLFRRRDVVFLFYRPYYHIGIHCRDDFVVLTGFDQFPMFFGSNWLDLISRIAQSQYEGLSEYRYRLPSRSKAVLVVPTQDLLTVLGKIHQFFVMEMFMNPSIFSFASDEKDSIISKHVKDMKSYEVLFQYGDQGCRDVVLFKNFDGYMLRVTGGSVADCNVSINSFLGVNVVSDSAKHLIMRLALLPSDALQQFCELQNRLSMQFVQPRSSLIIQWCMNPSSVPVCIRSIFTQDVLLNYNGYPPNSIDLLFCLKKYCSRNLVSFYYLPLRFSGLNCSPSIQVNLIETAGYDPQLGRSIMSQIEPPLHGILDFFDKLSGCVF